MDLKQKLLAGCLALFLVMTLLRVFRTPLKLAVKLLLNTVSGLFALWLVQLTSGATGIMLGWNLWNALVIGVLGLPGFALLLLAQLVL